MTMTTESMIVPVEDMSCDHCARRVKEALEGVDGVTEASVDLDGAEARISTAEPVSREQLAAAVEAAGYRIPSTP